jgi:hypothetical protein
MFLRIEENVRIKKDVNLEQGIEEAKERPFEIANAFEMVIKDKQKGGRRTNLILICIRSCQ